MLFKLDADSGDSWIVVGDNSSMIKAEVTSVFETEYLGEQVTIKIIKYSSTTLFINTVFWLADKYGVMRKDEALPLEST